MKRLVFIIIGLLLSVLANARLTVEVTDSLTGEPLPLATLQFKKPVKIMRVADNNGRVTVNNITGEGEVKVSFAGYKEKEFKFKADGNIQRFSLSPMEYELTEVVVKPGKEKYSKKNNPAVDLMQTLRRDEEKTDPLTSDYYSYDKYEKTLIALNNFTGTFDEGYFSKKMRFLENYVDTSNYTGRRLLDLIIKEKTATRITGKDPKADKEITTGYKSEGIDEAFSQENIRVVLEDVIREVDIYNPNINILQNRFVSPVSAIGPDFYKYYIEDTVYIGKTKCVELSFVPRNDKAFGFNGSMYIPVDDSLKYVKKIVMRTPRDINLNFLNNLYVSQNFEIDSLGKRHKTYDDVCIEMQIVAGTPEFYGRKTTVYDNFSYEKREELEDFYHKLGNELQLTDNIGQTAEFWNEKRMIPMTLAESRLSNFTKEMRKIPLLYWAEKFIGLMESGYLTTGKPSKFDIGPLNTLISFNDVEGVRIRLGGMTMAALNPHLFVKGYGAYGTKDHRWKYSGHIEYSFTKKPHHAYEWPRHGFYASYTYDLDLIGQHYLFTNQDNIFLSLKRKKSELVTYHRLAKGGYVLELPNNFSVEAGLSQETQYSTPWLPFVTSEGNHLDKYKRGSFNVSLRWARGEKFVQGRSTRLPVNMDAWVFQLTHDYCPKGVLGSAYTFNRTEVSVQKRLWFSAFGYLDFIAKGGKLWSSVYFPDLLWQNANLSYTIQPESFSLLNPMEFANDAYTSIDFTYFGNGVLFNYIPYINKLKLREAITFKGFKGWLSKRNDPVYNKGLLEFPGDCLAMKMGKTPYMELGAGIDNIFSVLRVDFVWRLTYRDNPDIDKWGIRISLHFTL